MYFYEILSLIATVRFADSGLVEQMRKITGEGAALKEIELPQEFTLIPPIKQDGIYSIDEIRQKIESFKSGCSLQYYNYEKNSDLEEMLRMREFLAVTCVWLGNKFGFFKTLSDPGYHYMRINPESENSYHSSTCLVFKERDWVNKERDYLPNLKLLWGQKCNVGSGELQVIYVAARKKNSDFLDVLDIVTAQTSNGGWPGRAVFVNTKVQSSVQYAFTNKAINLMKKHNDILAEKNKMIEQEKSGSSGKA